MIEKNKHTDPADPIATSADEMRAVVDGLASAALIGQTMGLQVLAAEMEIMSHLVPGMTDKEPDTRTAAEIDAEIEAGFDNMPI